MKDFFAKLDQELNKVNQFYRLKESEFLDRGETLNKQLEILLDLKQVMSDCRRKNQQARCNSGRSLYPRSNSSSLRASSDNSGQRLSSSSTISSFTYLEGMLVHEESLGELV